VIISRIRREGRDPQPGERSCSSIRQLIIIDRHVNKIPGERRALDILRRTPSSKYDCLTVTEITFYRPLPHAYYNNVITFTFPSTCIVEHVVARLSSTIDRARVVCLRYNSGAVFAGSPFRGVLHPPRCRVYGPATVFAVENRSAHDGTK